MPERTVCITQARMTSSRLRGKVLKTVGGRTLLDHHIERLKAIKGIDEIIIATTDNNADDAIVALAHDLEVSVFRGDEHDVLGRFYHAAMLAQATTVLRVTSDCPLLDPSLHSELVSRMKDDQSLDGGSIDINSYCRGLDGEIFRMVMLEDAYKRSTKGDEREHVTKYFYNNIDRYKWFEVTNSAMDLGAFRLCVDTLKDFHLAEKTLMKLGTHNKNFSWRETINSVAFD